MKLGLLSGIQQGEGPTGEFILMPGVGVAHLKFLEDLGVDLCYVLPRLNNAVNGREGSPAHGII